MNLLILFHSHIDNEQVSFHRVVYLQHHDIRNRVFLLRRCVPDSYVGTFPTSPYFADAFRKDGFECYPASGHQFAGWLCQPCPVGTYGNRKDRGCLKCPAGKKKNRLYLAKLTMTFYMHYHLTFHGQDVTYFVGAHYYKSTIYLYYFHSPTTHGND